MFKKFEFENCDFVDFLVTTKEVDSKNREDMKKVLEKLNMNIENLTSNVQTHSSIVNVVNKDNVASKKEGDAIITNLKEVPLLVFTADCVPICIIDTKNKAVGLVHAGWRGTYDRITKNTIDAMKKEYNTLEKDLVCIIGPSIGPCCYEVSKELVEKFNMNFTNKDEKFYKIENEKYNLDLWKLNEITLNECGVDKVINLNLCTSCNNESFYSYRKDNQTDKRIGTIVMIKDNFN